MITNRFKEYFNYTKRERNGIIVLLIILVMLVVVDTYLNKKTFGGFVELDEQFKLEVEQFEKTLELKKKEETQTKVFKKNIKRKRKIAWKLVDELFDFDPNTVNKTNLKKLGFSKKQITTVYNFREKGGVFYKKEDVLKIYGIDTVQYKHLESYIKINNVISKPDALNQIVELILQVELNSAKKEDLTKLKGIGESFANRILAYRKLLGGFYTKEQLNEVYGMDSVRYNKFSNAVIIDTLLIQKMNVNKVKFKTLLKHPYLNKYQTQSIMKYREISGKFLNIEQIVESNLLLEDDFIKIKPYLTIQD
jgi:competence ComEA-like helix-hairpin-helix protein